MTGPQISVVVSTRDRPERLHNLLTALQAQTLDPSCFEVVVVDNGERLTAAAGPEQGDSTAVRHLRLDRPAGPAAGRNLGWRAARAELIAFTDDDCEPAPGWLAAALTATRRHPGAIVQGATVPIERERHRDGLLAHTVCIERLGPQFQTCNIVYPRALLVALNGFDEGFGMQPAGEDTDLAWRALAAGAGAVFAADAVVHHAVHTMSAAQSLRRAARWSAAARVFAHHPGARTMLWRRWFWNVWHYLLWRSVLALPAPRWLRRLILTRHLLALAARARTGGVRGPGLIAAVPFLLVHDAVECAAIARGAIRARTLVL